ncbi:MAG: flagellar basal body L-ring protein FlgH [Pseudomonadota bacterium]
MTRPSHRIFLSLFGALVLTGCAETFADIGRAPSMSAVDTRPLGAINGTVTRRGSYGRKNANFSIWDNRKGDLFSDDIAMQPGDILTVIVSIDDQAQLNNQSNSNRTVGRGLNGSGDFAVGGVGNDAEGNANVGSTSNFSGAGGTRRSESISLSVAVLVEDTLPGGNLIVRGSQEVRVNSELRILTIEGIVRPTDIGPKNTISYERIAEARISYGGRGHVSQVQRPPYGQQLLNRILPF